MFWRLERIKQRSLILKLPAARFRSGPGKGGGGELLMTVGSCAYCGRLESLDFSVGSERPCAPEEDTNETIVFPVSYFWLLLLVSLLFCHEGNSP